MKLLVFLWNWWIAFTGKLRRFTVRTMAAAAADNTGEVNIVAMVLIIIGTPRTNTMVSSILALVGNLGAALVLDYLFFHIFSWWKVAGIAMILAGTAWMEKVKAAERKKEPESAGSRPA